MADLACNISSGNICNVSGDIKSLKGPQLVETDGSELIKTVGTNIAKTLKIKDFNPNYKYKIQQILDGSEILDKSQESNTRTTFALNSYNNYTFKQDISFQDDIATAFEVLVVYGQDGYGRYVFYDENGDEIPKSGGGIAKRSGNYFRYYFSADSGGTDTDFDNRTPEFKINWYKTVTGAIDLNINSDGTFTFNTPTTTANTFKIALTYETSILCSNTEIYTLTT